MALSLQFTRMGYMVLLVSQLSVFCCIPQPPFTLPIYVHIVLNCIFAFFGKQITIPWYFSLCVDPSDCSPQTFSNLIGTSSLRVLQEACAILHYLIKGQKMQLYTSQQIKQQSLGQEPFIHRLEQIPCEGPTTTLQGLSDNRANSMEIISSYETPEMKHFSKYKQT